MLRESGLHTAVDDDVVASLAERLVRVTAGNPFYLSEVLVSMRERGPGVSFDTLDRTIPDALGDFVIDRVARLSPVAVETLDVAAVAGSEVTLDVLVAATGYALADLIDATDEA
ncbi:MAG TPA: hypothetical protein VLN74_13615, partial [Ilumatobacteraceae bacterium]|nr:hypothetical protein [Ilumatobacteraceae bacterium]